MHVVVCGAGPVGAVVALLLAAEGHRVTVLDGGHTAADSAGVGIRGAVDSGPPAGDQPLLIPSAVADVLSLELPGVAPELTSATGTRHTEVVVRRSLVLSVLTEEMERTERIELKRGVAAVSLLTGAQRLPGRPHIQGVLTTEGQAVLADLVVDATGRDSRGIKWLSDVGAPRPLDERQEVGNRLFTRYFRSADGIASSSMWSLHHFDGVLIAMVSAGRDLWSMTLCVSDEDSELYRLSGASLWTRAADVYAPRLPQLGGTPLPGVWTTPRIESHYRRFVRDGMPVATGTVSVGDAWGATLPLLGLGPTMGLLQAVMLRDSVRQGDPDGVLLRFDLLAENYLVPLHEHITRWEEQLQTARGHTPPTRPALAADLEIPAGLGYSSATLLSSLWARCAAPPYEAFPTERNGPSLAELVEALSVS